MVIIWFIVFYSRGFWFFVYSEQNDLVAHPHISFVFCQKKICFQCRPLNFLCNKSCYCNHSMRLICECVDTHIDIYKISFDLWLFYFSSCIFPKKHIIQIFRILVFYYTDYPNHNLYAVQNIYYSNTEIYLT